jgi:hypothetical protein
MRQRRWQMHRIEHLSALYLARAVGSEEIAVDADI